MTVKTNWQCPYCKSYSVMVNETNYLRRQTVLDQGQSGGPRLISFQFRVCSNPNCRQYTLEIDIYRTYPECHKAVKENNWTLLPNTDWENSREGVPKVILNDLVEAVNILKFSPRCAALLARRCLEHIIGDFYQLKKKPLPKALLYLKWASRFRWKLIEPVVINTIEARRSANRRIDAYLGKGVSLANDVSQNDAAELIQIVELMLTETYISKHQKTKQAHNLKKL